MCILATLCALAKWRYSWFHPSLADHASTVAVKLRTSTIWAFGSEQSLSLSSSSSGVFTSPKLTTVVTVESSLAIDKYFLLPYLWMRKPNNHAVYTYNSLTHSPNRLFQLGDSSYMYFRAISDYDVLLHSPFIHSNCS